MEKKLLKLDKKMRIGLRFFCSPPMDFDVRKTFPADYYGN